MNSTGRIKSVMYVCLLSLTIQGCAALNQAGNANRGNAALVGLEDVTYIVKPGDSLSDIAERVTGDVDNWQAIADVNGIADPRKLAAGDSLQIPTVLLQQVFNINDQQSPRPNKSSDPVMVASTSSKRNGTPAIGTTLAVKRAVDADLSVANQVKLHAVSVNRRFDLVPFDAQSSSSTRSSSYASQAPSVRVVGTYFPKGVYEGPANYSRLIMRVSPGTVFELDSEVNDWYKVITDKGIGYVRSADAVLVPGQSS